MTQTKIKRNGIASLTAAQIQQVNLAMLRGYTVSALADKAGIAHATLSHVLNGGACRLSTLGKIFSAVGIQYDD